MIKKHVEKAAQFSNLHIINFKNRKKKSISSKFYNSLTVKMLFHFKQLYDIEGLDGCNQLLKTLLESPDKNRLKLVIQLIKILYKMDTCEMNCFDNLGDKDFCSCSCNDSEIVISFD